MLLIHIRRQTNLHKPQRPRAVDIHRAHRALDLDLQQALARLQRVEDLLSLILRLPIAQLSPKTPRTAACRRSTASSPRRRTSDRTTLRIYASAPIDSPTSAFLRPKTTRLPSIRTSRLADPALGRSQTESARLPRVSCEFGRKSHAYSPVWSSLRLARSQKAPVFACGSAGCSPNSRAAIFCPRPDRSPTTRPNSPTCHTEFPRLRSSAPRNISD